MELGRDFNGHPLVSEKRAWLDEEGVENPNLREEYKFLWRELEREDAELREESRQKAKSKQPAKPGRRSTTVH